MLMVWQLIWEHFAKWLDTVAEILAEGTGGLRAVEALFRYIVSITPTAPPPEVWEALRRRLGPQLEARLVSWGELLRPQQNPNNPYPPPSPRRRTPQPCPDLLPKKRYQ